MSSRPRLHFPPQSTRSRVNIKHTIQATPPGSFYVTVCVCNLTFQHSKMAAFRHHLSGCGLDKQNKNKKEREKTGGKKPTRGLISGCAYTHSSTVHTLCFPSKRGLFLGANESSVECRSERVSARCSAHVASSYLYKHSGGVKK